jgi:hypothetical protein
LANNQVTGFDLICQVDSRLNGRGLTMGYDLHALDSGAGPTVLAIYRQNDKYAHYQSLPSALDSGPPSSVIARTVLS